MLSTALGEVADELKELPERIRCKKCDAVIYEDVELMAPYEIARRYDGRCPRCGGRLSSTPTNFKVWKRQD